MKKNRSERPFSFRPGWVIQDCSSAEGGIQYLREHVDEKQINKKRGLQIEHKTRKIVDNVEYCAHIDAVVKKVDYVLRKHCARTDMGWYADDAALRVVRTEIAEIREEAAQLNRLADRAGSERRAKIHITPLRLDLTQPEVAYEVVYTMQNVLTELHTALRAGDIASLHKLKLRAKNIERLVTGDQSHTIRHAIDSVPAAANEIRHTMRGSSIPPEEIGAELDLTALETALELFDTSWRAERDYVLASAG